MFNKIYLLTFSHYLYRTKASLAGALTMLQYLPDKIRPVVKPLMESIKKESNEMLQVKYISFYQYFINI